MAEGHSYLRELRLEMERFERDHAAMWAKMDAEMRARGSTGEPSPGPRDETRSESGGGPDAWPVAVARIAKLEAEVELANHHLERCREGYRLQYEAIQVYQRQQEELKADRDEKHRALQGTAGRSDRLMRALERIAECYWTDGETMTIDEAQAIARDALDGE